MMKDYQIQTNLYWILGLDNPVYQSHYKEVLHYRCKLQMVFRLHNPDKYHFRSIERNHTDLLSCKGSVQFS